MHPSYLTKMLYATDCEWQDAGAGNPGPVPYDDNQVSFDRTPEIARPWDAFGFRGIGRSTGEVGGC